VEEEEGEGEDEEESRNPSPGLFDEELVEGVALFRHDGSSVCSLPSRENRKRTLSAKKGNDGTGNAV
jgi:hypothetical protein